MGLAGAVGGGGGRGRGPLRPHFHFPQNSAGQVARNARQPNSNRVDQFLVEISKQIGLIKADALEIGPKW